MSGAGDGITSLVFPYIIMPCRTTRRFLRIRSMTEFFSSLMERNMVSSGTSSKTVYKVKNWRDYNESLVRRGDITFWLDEDVIDS